MAASYPSAKSNLEESTGLVSTSTAGHLNLHNLPAQEINAVEDDLVNAQTASLQTPAASASTITNKIGQILQQIKNITGGTNWYDTPGAHTTDVISEKTPAAGVTVDGLLIKDSKLATNNSVVTANITAAAVTPPKWTNPYKFRVRRAAAQNTTGASFIKVNFDTKDFDSNNNFDSTTNFRYTAPVAGYYQFNARLSSNGNTQLIIALYKNGSILERGDHNLVNAVAGVSLNTLAQAAASDYFEIFVFADTTGALEISTGVFPIFSGFLVSET